MAGTAYPKRAIKQNRRTTRAKIGKTVKLARMGEIDYTFLFIVILLLSFGLVMLLSASAPAGNTLHNNSYYFFNKQFLCAILGLIGMWVISRIDYNKYKKYRSEVYDCMYNTFGLRSYAGFGCKIERFEKMA